MHGSRERDVVQPCGRQHAVLQKMNHRLSTWPSKPTAGVSTEKRRQGLENHLLAHVHGSVTHNSQALGAPGGPSTDKRKNKAWPVHTLTVTQP